MPVKIVFNLLTITVLKQYIEYIARFINLLASNRGVIIGLHRE